MTMPRIRRFSAPCQPGAPRRRRPWAACLVAALFLAPLANAQFVDNFDRADDPAVGNGWIEKNPDAFALSGNGVAKLATPLQYRDNIVYRPTSENLLDTEVSVEFIPSQARPGYPQIYARVQTDTVGVGNRIDGYMLYVVNSDRRVRLGRQVGSSFVTTLVQFDTSTPFIVGERHRLRLQATGTNPVDLTAIVEQWTGSAWNIIGQASYADADAQRIATAGSVGFSGHTGAAFRYDNFQRTDLGGSGGPNPVPVTTTISPSSAVAGSNGLILTVEGNDFVPGAEVLWNGSSRPTTFISSTILEADISAADLAVEGSASVTVFNPAPGGGTSNAQTFTIDPPQTDNPVPVADSITPDSAFAGGPAFVLTVNGSDFASNAVVRWNGSDRVTQFITPNELRAQITQADIAAEGTATVTVFNPAPAGGTSQGITFTIEPPPPDNPVPVATALTPQSATAGDAGFTLTVTGSDFAQNAVVRWNGSDRTTTFVSSAELQAQITAADIASEGTASVTVFNPSPGGGLSQALNFDILPPPNPVPTINSLNPASVSEGSGAFTLTVLGTGLTEDSQVQWNGTDRVTIFISSTALQASIGAADVASAGTANVTVVNPAPGGGTSNVAQFTITSGGSSSQPPVVGGLVPQALDVGSTTSMITVQGANFDSGSVVRWNGQQRDTTFISDSELQVVLPSTDLDSITVAAITVVSAAGTSAPLSFFVTELGASSFHDTFDRPDNENIGNGWTEKTPDALAIVNNEVRGGETVEDYRDALVYRPVSEDARDVELGMEFVRTTGRWQFPQLHARIQRDTVEQATTLESYIFFVDDYAGSPGRAIIAIQPPIPNSFECYMLAIPFATPLQDGQRYRLRFRVAGQYPVQLTGYVDEWDGSQWQVFASGGFNHDENFFRDQSLYCAPYSVPDPIVTAGAMGFAKWTAPTDRLDNFYWISSSPAPLPPTITALSPSSVLAGSDAFTLTVNGSDFTEETVVTLEGSARPTTFVSSSVLEVAISAADVATEGQYQVVADTPSVGTSDPVLLSVYSGSASFFDDFNRPDSGILGNGWQEKNPNAFYIVNNAASKQGTTTSMGYRNNIAYRPASESVLDSEVAMEFVLDTLPPGFPQIFNRVQTDTVQITNVLDGYIFYIDNNATRAVLGRQRGNSFLTTLDTLALSSPLQAGQRYRLRLRAQGTNPVQLYAAVESFDGVSWNVIGQTTVPDSAPNRIQTAGSSGFSGFVESNYDFDNFEWLSF